MLEDENAYNPGKDNFPGAKGGGGAVGPMMVRLAWHCSGTWSCSHMNGGSDGATMRFQVGEETKSETVVSLCTPPRGVGLATP